MNRRDPIGEMIQRMNGGPVMDLFVWGSKTSREAAESIRPAAGSLRLRVYLEIKNAEGLTCDAVEERLGLAHQTVSPRIYELRKLGQIRDSGTTRKTRSGRAATVWIITNQEATK